MEFIHIFSTNSSKKLASEYFFQLCYSIWSNGFFREYWVDQRRFFYTSSVTKATRNNFPAFLLELVTHPISLVLTIAVIFILISQTKLWPWFLKLFKRKNAQVT